MFFICTFNNSYSANMGIVPPMPMPSADNAANPPSSMDRKDDMSANKGDSEGKADRNAKDMFQPTDFAKLFEDLSNLFKKGSIESSHEQIADLLGKISEGYKKMSEKRMKAVGFMKKWSQGKDRDKRSNNKKGSYGSNKGPWHGREDGDRD